MTVSAVPSLASPPPATADAPPAGAPASDGATGFAAMFAGLGQSGAKTPSTAATPVAAKPGQDDQQPGQDAGKDADEDGAAATLPDLVAMIGGTGDATPVTPAPARAKTADRKVDDGLLAALMAQPAVSPSINVPASAKAGTDNAPTAPVAGQGKTPPPAVDGTEQDTPSVSPSDTADAGEDAARTIDLSMPSLSALPAKLRELVEKQSSAPGVAGDQPAAKPVQQPDPVQQSALAQPATATLMAARVSAQAGGADARSPTPDKKTSDKRDADDTTAIDATSDTSLAGGPAGAAQAPAHATKTASSIDTASQSLAATGADRQVDLARSHAWLDGLARDIAHTSDGSGKLRFDVAPQALGTVHVELTQGDDGSSVKLTAATEAARDMLADARPQLIAEARSHGIRIADAQVQVDISGGQTRSDQQPGNRDSAPSPQHQAGSGFSMQAGTGDNGRQQQGQLRQTEPDYRLGNPSALSPAPEEASASTSTPSDDALYA